MIAYKPYGLSQLSEEITRDEGRRKKPYKDSEGILTIGIGWNLEANGLPDEVIDLLLVIGIENAERALDRIWKRWRMLSPNRQRVLLNMAFNLGETRLRGFKKMWAALEKVDYLTASREMLDSKWAQQVGVRATRLSKAMVKG